MIIKTITKTVKNSSLLLSAVSLALVSGLSSCDSDDDIPTSGSSTSGVTPPASVLTRSLIGTHVSGDPDCHTDGTDYTFVDETTIHGAGSVSINTTSYSYTTSGSQGRIVLNYTNGTEIYTLNFETSRTGTYSVAATPTGGNTVNCRGTFVLR